MTHQIIIELLKALSVGSFLFLFFYSFKKATRIGKALEAYLLVNKLELKADYKKKLLSKVIFKFFSFKVFDEKEMENYLKEEVLMTSEFLKNLIPLNEVDQS